VHFNQFDLVQAIRQLPLIVTFLVFPLLAVTTLRKLSSVWRVRGLAAVVLTILPLLCVFAATGAVRLHFARQFILVSLVAVAAYVACAIVSWWLLCIWGRDQSARFWIAFLFPILILVLIRFVPGQWHFYFPGKHLAEIFLGLSYFACRLSQLAIEYRNGVVEAPSLSAYLAFAFFPLTLSVGPISPYHLFRDSLNNANRPVAAARQCWLRFLVGLTKFLFLARLAEQLSYQGLLLDGHPHSWIDLPVAMVAYYFYLYLNFSGWCDMAIGTAGLAGFQVAENFNDPMLSRNLQEFWTRWHMTLTGYMRDVVFTPLSKALVRAWGPKNAKHAIAVSIFCVFVVMGCWHGLTWNYFIYDALQGVGVIAAHYYTIHLKKRLGRDGYARYESNPWLHWSGVAVTFVYACTTLFFFANPLDRIARILGVFR
jgi:D-alanyl-lipoteichoic acid acyltransferase DltB (MBOAT superfamily)